MANLFSDFKIKNITVKNRIVMPPAVCFGWAGNDGFVTDEHVLHYEKIAKGGAGFIVVEATCIDKDGRLADTQIGVWSDEHVEGLKRIADACHRYGTTVVVQIHHAGIQTPGTVNETPSGPSEILHRGKVIRALSLDEIRKIQDQFVDAAGRVKAAGFDGVEIHGAHGYLVDQFMSPVTNKRKDQYGGTLENRMRFGVEIVTRIKEEFGNDFIIDYRMGGNAPGLEEGIQIAKALELSGVDILHVSAGISGENRPDAPEGFPYNWIVYMGTEIKKHVSVPVIAVNGISTPKQAEYLIENNLADFVAVCRAQLADHSWASKAISGEEILNCLECPKCQWFADGRKCPRSKNN